MSTKNTTKTRRVVLLAFEQMNLLDLSGPLQALASANRLHAGKGGALYDTCVASAHGGLVTTSSGLPIMTVSIATLDRVTIDTLIVPGGCKGDTFHSPPELVRWIAKRAPRVRRLCSVCTGAFLLAATGLYSVVSFSVTQRTQEVGLRMALGAPRASILRLVITSTAVMLAAGVAAGLVLSVALSRVVGQWAGGTPRDPLTLLGAALILMLVSAIACVGPAWRAASVDPMVALRYE